MSTAPATSDGVTLQVNFRPGPVSSETPSARHFLAMAATSTLSDTAAAPSQTAIHDHSVPIRGARSAATRATTPMATPPMPETWVNEPERSIVSRM